MNKFHNSYQYIITTIIGCMMLFSSVSAQDIHYSQAHNSPLNISPALTGIFNQDVRFSAHYRHQWYSVPVPYLTFTGAFDKKFYQPGNDVGFFSGGILFNFDQAGDSRLTMIQLGLSGSYTYMINKNNLLTAGLQVGGANRHFSMEQLSWDNQFNGYMFDPNLSSGETFDVMNLFYLSTGGGLNYRWQKSSRTHIDLGVAAYNFTSPQNNFYKEEDNNKATRFTGYVQTSFKVAGPLDLMVHGLGQLQGSAYEVVPALLLRIHLNQQPGKVFSLDLGAIGRWSGEWDAVAPTIGMKVNNFRAELSYDINLSEFTIATNRLGGPELSIQYFITHVKPMGSFKTCPIF